jgi:DnaJ like chaperone protein
MGKIAGFVIGLILYGFPGAIIGAVLGHYLFDAGNKKQRTTIFRSTNMLEAHFYQYLFGMLAKMAKADGRISQSEIDTIDHLIRNQFRLSEEGRKVAINFFRDARSDNRTFSHYAQTFASTFQRSEEVMYLALQMLFAVARADGRISREEEQLLHEAATIFGLSDRHYQFVHDQYDPQSELDKYYAILESKPEDSDDQIRENYRRLAKEHHPDRAQGKGLPADFIKFATEKFQEIQEAFGKVKSARGMQ